MILMIVMSYLEFYVLFKYVQLSCTYLNGNHYMTLKNHAEQQINDGVKIENRLLLREDENEEINLTEIGESAATELYLSRNGEHRSQRVDDEYEY